MKKLALTLAFISTSAQSAYWKDVGNSAIGPVRVDVLSIEEVRGTRFAWVMWNHRKDTLPSGSTMMRYRFDCKDKRTSSLQYVAYSKENLGGIATDIQWQNERATSQVLPADSVPMQAFSTVCSPNIAKQAKPTSQNTEWLQVAQGSKFIISIDLASIATEGTYRRAWTLWQRAQSPSGTESKNESESSKQLFLYNCRDGSVASRRMVTYADRFAEGKVLSDHSSPKDKFNFIDVSPPGPVTWGGSLSDPYWESELGHLGITLKAVCSYPLK